MDIEIEKILLSKGCKCDKKMQDNIGEWKDWYKGFVPSFHSYTVFNGLNRIGQKRKTLRLPKKVCEDWANLIMNEKVSISVEDENINNALSGCFSKNDFWVEANRLIEKTFALGTGAFVEYDNGNKEPIIDYITADMIYPISWDSSRITDVAFISTKYINNSECWYFNIHTKSPNGNYVIENSLYRKSDGAQLPLADGVQGIVETGSNIPRFQIIRPNIANNIKSGTPMGVSVFANAIDEIKGCDLIFDSYINEFILGKKRIMVPRSMTQMSIEESGAKVPVFDTNDTVFYAISGREDENEKPFDINFDIRAQEHKESLQNCLDLVSDKCGLGKDHYKLNGGAKTATEVVSENSEMFRNLKKHEICILSSLIGLTKSCLDIMGYNPDTEVTINFDDSIIEDKNTEFARDMQMVGAGIMKPWEMRVKYMGETEEMAKQAVAESAEDDIVEE